MTRSNLHLGLVVAIGLILVSASLAIVWLAPRALAAAASPCGCSLAASGIGTSGGFTLLLGAAFVLGRSFYAIVKTTQGTRSFLRRALRGSVPITPRRLGVDPGWPIDLIPGSSAVFCYGLLRPRIAVGEEIVRLMDQAQLQSIVAHEAAHASRRDPLRLFVASVVATLLGRWLGGGRLIQAYTLDVESDADQAAIRRYGRGPLAEAFLRLLEVSEPRLAPVPALSVTESRILRLLGTERRPSLFWTLLLAATFALVGVLGIRAIADAAAAEPTAAAVGAMCLRPPSCSAPVHRRVICYQTHEATVCLSSGTFGRFTYAR